jgi:SpoVK/Ycf46/Vps4 family AAA+-type ATPase
MASMARSDLLLSLVQAGSRGDSALFKATVEALIAEERAKHHNVLAERLAHSLSDNGARGAPLPQSKDGLAELAYEVIPERRLSDLVLGSTVAETSRDLIEEQQRVDLLRSYNVEPRHRVLLIGPPGNGKTALAEAIATEALVPLFAVRYEALITSFLGETAARMSRLFEAVRTHRCVLFFDEFDTVGKERGDEHETGEVKRVVSSLLLQIDRLPSHVIVVAATNHAELLDRAVWRRFQIRLQLPPPTAGQAAEWIDRLGERFGTGLGLAPRTIADQLKGASFAELEDFALDVRRRFVLELPDADLRRITQRELNQWRARLEVS